MPRVRAMPITRSATVIPCRVCGALTSSPEGICSFCKSKEGKITQIGIRAPKRGQG